MYSIVINILIPLVSAFLGAILAFMYQRVAELKRDKRFVLQSLMIYRNVTVDELDFIKAINAIPLTFSKDKKVMVLYHKWIAFTKPPLFESLQHIDVFYQLLYEMGQCSGYNKLTIADIEASYAPMALDKHYPRWPLTPAPSNPNDDQAH